MLIAILDESPLTAQGRPALALSPYTGRGDTPSPISAGGLGWGGRDDLHASL